MTVHTEAYKLALPAIVALENNVANGTIKNRAGLRAGLNAIPINGLSDDEKGLFGKRVSAMLGTIKKVQVVAQPRIKQVAEQPATVSIPMKDRVKNITSKVVQGAQATGSFIANNGKKGALLFLAGAAVFVKQAVPYCQPNASMFGLIAGKQGTVCSAVTTVANNLTTNSAVVTLIAAGVVYVSIKASQRMKFPAPVAEEPKQIVVKNDAPVTAPVNNQPAAPLEVDTKKVVPALVAAPAPAPAAKQPTPAAPLDADTKKVVLASVAAPAPAPAAKQPVEAALPAAPLEVDTKKVVPAPAAKKSAPNTPSLFARIFGAKPKE